MTVRVAAIILAVALYPARLYAQDTVFTVNDSSADVHKGPSVATPVIGHVAQGTTMPVLRDLGSWVKVPWPDAPDGFAYVYMSTGQVTPRNANGSTAKPASRASATAPTSAGAKSAAAKSSTPASTGPLSASSSSGVQTARPPHHSHERVVIRSAQDSTPISHVVGVGGLFGSMESFGATARAWRDDRLGVQMAFMRDSMTSSTTPGRVTSVQFEPAVVYGLFDHVSDYFWVRPYVGSGISVRHQSLQDATPTGTQPDSSTGVGVRVFGGAEMTFAGAPRFALSVDAGYRKFETPFPGFEPDRFSVFVSGNWYIK